MQGALLDTVISEDGEQLSLPDASLRYYPAFYSPVLCADYFQRLRAEIPWQQDTLNFGGKAVPVPRLQAWFGDKDTHYGYSGLQLTPHPWTPLLSVLREDLQTRLALPFNSVLLNWYRSGADSVAWHSDDEPALGPDPVIASLSFGTARLFELRHKQQKTLQKISLCDGSLLVMGSGTQRHWQHRIPKQPGISAERINLTFRFIHTMA
jgi:alkylated DNA repair dioxygenase AlkB